MAGGDTPGARFHQVPATVVGDPEDYVGRPGFQHGGTGVAARWYGGARAVSAALTVAARSRGSHPVTSSTSVPWTSACTPPGMVPGWQFFSQVKPCLVPVLLASNTGRRAKEEGKVMVANSGSRLAGKVALVTGAARGIGRGIAESMAAEGARIVVHYRSREREAAETVAALEGLGTESLMFGADLTDSSAVRAMFRTAAEEFGGVDIVVANAGTNSSHAAAADTTDEEFDRLLEVNTRSTFFVLRQAAREIRDGGRIINVSSSSVENPQRGFAAYATTKAAALATVRVLAEELGERGITANTVMAGAVASGFLDPAGDAAQRLGEDLLRELARSAPAGRLGTPADIAAVATFLAGDDAAWVNGQTLLVNGGGRL